MLHKKSQKVDLGDEKFQDVINSMAQNQPQPLKIYDVNSLSPRPIEIDEATRDKMMQAGYLRRPHVKFVKKIAPVQEAVFFAGGEESANQVIEWVMMHGDVAEHVSNKKGLIPEWISIVGIDIAGDPVRNAVRPNWWIIYEGDGVYAKVYDKNFKESYREIANEDGDSNV